MEPGTKVRLYKIAAFKDNHESHDSAKAEIEKHVERTGKLQYQRYADDDQSLLVVLQALDADGREGGGTPRVQRNEPAGGVGLRLQAAQ